ncbi:MAG: efflux RND transporter permease subunit [Chloroflexota bacterium]
MSWLTRIAIKKRWVTLLIVALVTGASIWATLRLNMELIPDIELPITTVVTVYPQASPEEVMREVTIPIEEAIAGIKGLDHINSTSVAGMTFTLAIFEYGTGMDKVNSTIRQKLGELSFPPEVLTVPDIMPQVAENPQLHPISIDMMPVVMLSLSGNLSTYELRDIALYDIVPRLESIDGVYDVGVEGGSEEMVLVDLDPEKMSEYGISISQITDILAFGEYNSLIEIEKTVMEGAVVLGDIASVALGPPPETAIAHTNGERSVSIFVMKVAEANTVSVANTVMDEVESIKTNLNTGLELVPVFDQSTFIENSISDLARNAVVGTVLAIFVVFLFLMAFRASLVTAVSIPLSLLVGFMAMKVWGLTINLLTLSAMVIAVGRVIDNSIVVLEVMYRRMRGGEVFREAALNGVREIATPITSATLATVVIFLPLAFIGGIVGEMFVPFALTITFTLIAALLVALMVVPPLSDVLVSGNAAGTTRETWYQGVYTRMLRWSLTHRGVTLMIVAVLFFGSFGLIPMIGTTFMPTMGEATVTVEIQMPPGTSLMVTENAVVRAEEIIGRNPAITLYQTSAGTSSSLFGGFSALTGGGPSTATIEVYMDSQADLEREAAELRGALEGVVGNGTITVTVGGGLESTMGGSGLNISIRGEEQDEIARVARQLLNELEGMDEIANVRLDLASVGLELDLEPDSSRFLAAGLPQEQFEQVGQELLLMRRGGAVGMANIEGENYDIFLNGIAQGLDSEETARQLRVGWPTSVALGDIAEVHLEERQLNIQRTDQKRAATISGSIAAKDVGAVNREVQKKINGLSLPPGVEIAMGGLAEMMEESFSGMFRAIIIAVVLAYAVLVVTFRSLLTPLILMASLPLASIGAFPALLIAGQPLGISALMGILMLVGIVLTNAVVLITVVEQMHMQGMSKDDALVRGGRIRLRPILMTALTTILAMLPLAVIRTAGTLIGAELATVVIGGLFSSTLLTLLVIPVLYSLLKRSRSQPVQSPA